MLGHPDEYNDASCPARNPVNTGTVMDNPSANIPQRLMTRFADNVGSSVVAIWRKHPLPSTRDAHQ